MLPLQLHDHTRGFLGSTNTKWPWQHSHAHARQHVIHVTPVLASQPPSASSSKLKNWSVCSNASEQLGPKRKQGASTTALDLKTSKRFLGKRKQAMEIHGNLTEHAGKSCWNSEFPKLWKGIQIAGKSFNQICMFPWVVYRWQRLQPNLTGAISSVSLDKWWMAKACGFGSPPAHGGTWGVQIQDFHTVPSHMPDRKQWNALMKSHPFRTLRADLTSAQCETMANRRGESPVQAIVVRSQTGASPNTRSPCCRR